MFNVLFVQQRNVPLYAAGTLHNVQFVKYDVTVSFMAQVLDTVSYFVSHVLVVDTVTYFDIFR